MPDAKAPEKLLADPDATFDVRHLKMVVDIETVLHVSDGKPPRRV